MWMIVKSITSGLHSEDSSKFNVSLLLRDQTADERSLPVLFKALLANELGHLKLRDAVAQGRAPANRNEVEEAFSDYCSFAVTPPREILYGVLDVLASTTLRYGLSKECALMAAREFGVANLPGFTPKMTENSIERLVDYLNDASNVTALPKFKSALLAAYRRKLTAEGIPGDLFESHQ